MKRNASLFGFGMVALVLLGSWPAGANTPCAGIDRPKCRIELSTGISMAYLEMGPASGDTVILVHGLTDSSHSWSTTMQALHEQDSGLRILAVDQRGHGASSMPLAAICAPAPEHCFRIQDFAADLVAFMQTKGIVKATLAGHSLGSFVVQEVALSRPELVERAVLVATSTKGVDNAALRDFVLKEPVEGSWRRALEAQGRRYPEEVYDLTPLDADPAAAVWIAKSWVVDPIADPAFIRSYVPETAHVRLGTWIGATRALLATDHTERLKGMRVPTLVLWGTQDNIFPAEPDQNAIKASLGAAAEAMGTPFFWKQYGRRPLPVSGLQEDDIGHNVQWSAPEQVAADLRGFMVHGRPVRSLPHSDAPARVDRVVVDTGRPVIRQQP